MIATGGKNGKSRVRKIAKKNNKRTASTRVKKNSALPKKLRSRCGK